MTMTAEVPRALTLVRVLLNALRGALIGIAELIPGISGGTVALITGVYERLIDAVAHVAAATRRLVMGPDRLAGFREEAKRTDWALVIPVIVGMATAVLAAAGVVEALVSANPLHARALFFGLVAVSIVVPLRLVPKMRVGAARRIAELGVLLLAAATAFALVGFADGGLVADPAPWIVFVAAAIAICALVVPGVSGSFFLLAVGLYSTTLQALHNRDLGYIAIFAAGALLGLVTIVRLVRHLLRVHRRITLIAMTGLMAGSLRALWPWQTSASGDTHGVGVLLPPSGPVAVPLLLMGAGAASVALLILVEARAGRASHPRPVERTSR